MIKQDKNELAELGADKLADMYLELRTYFEEITETAEQMKSIIIILSDENKKLIDTLNTIRGDTH